MERLLRLREVIATTGLCRSNVYKAVRTRELAPPVRLFGRTVGWKAGDVRAFINSRPPARDLLKAEDVGRKQK
jgi:prophage regulatory protein